MSRQHRGGYCPPAKTFPKLRVPNVTPIGMQVVNQMADAMVEKKNLALSHTATVLTFFNQYTLTQLEWLLDVLDGDGTKFSGDLIRLARATRGASQRFIDCFEKQINPVSKQEWISGYDQFQEAMDNWFKREEAYKERGDGERTKEINRAAALRYHDPYEKNPQRCFESGFREGAAYADLHPVGMVTIRTDEGNKDVPIKDIVEYYARAHYPKADKINIEIELNKA